MVYQLAEALHKRVPEILDMTREEFAGWLAYYRIKAQKNT